MHEFSEEEYNLMKKYGGTCLKCGCKNSIQEKRVLSDEERSEIEEIEKRYNQDLTLEIIAEQFHFHPNSLSRLFKRQTTISFYQYLQKIRLKHAYYDLTHTNMKIIDIALNHGFKNVKSFENVFKKEYHTTPTKYRKVNN